MASLISDVATLKRIAELITRYHQLPFSPANSIPGSVMEATLGIARGPEAEVLRTYDFVDVIDRKNHFGWQVKSTKLATPVTWKRAKIENAGQKRTDARKSPAAAQEVGNEIIAFCNKHARESLDRYDLNEIGYARLVVNPNNTATYFERPLVTMASLVLFHPENFTWEWSEARTNANKDQQPSLAAYDQKRVRWFSWYSENQLHFNNEKAWWPALGDPNRIDFNLPTTKIKLEELMGWLESLDDTAITTAGPTSASGAGDDQ